MLLLATRFITGPMNAVILISSHPPLFLLRSSFVPSLRALDVFFPERAFFDQLCCFLDYPDSFRLCISGLLHYMCLELGLCMLATRIIAEYPLSDSGGDASYIIALLRLWRRLPEDRIHCAYTLQETLVATTPRMFLRTAAAPCGVSQPGALPGYSIHLQAANDHALFAFGCCGLGKISSTSNTTIIFIWSWEQHKPSCVGLPRPHHPNSYLSLSVVLLVSHLQPCFLHSQPHLPLSPGQLLLTILLLAVPRTPPDARTYFP